MVRRNTNNSKIIKCKTLIQFSRKCCNCKVCLMRELHIFSSILISILSFHSIFFVHTQELNFPRHGRVIYSHLRTKQNVSKVMPLPVWNLYTIYIWLARSVGFCSSFIKFNSFLCKTCIIFVIAAQRFHTCPLSAQFFQLNWTFCEFWARTFSPLPLKMKMKIIFITNPILLKFPWIRSLFVDL